MRTIDYEHRVQYYETDGMGCVHHSNYLRWFEEARGFYMRENGYPYEEMDRAGLMSPVISAELSYKTMARYGEIVLVRTTLETYTGTRASFTYEVIGKESGALHCAGRTGHCFLNGQGRPVSLKKAMPDYHQRMLRELEG